MDSGSQCARSGVECVQVRTRAAQLKSPKKYIEKNMEKKNTESARSPRTIDPEATVKLVGGGGRSNTPTAFGDVPPC